MNSKPGIAPSSRRWCLVALLAATGLLAAIGCQPSGPPRAAIAGDVLVDGKPLPTGTIRFVPIGATVGPKVSLPIVNGSFSANDYAGPIIGLNRVEIQSNDMGGYAMDDEQALQRLKKSRSKIHALRIPSRYNERSEISVQIAERSNPDLHFTLQVQNRPPR